MPILKNLTRRATLLHLQKMKIMQEKLGPEFKFLSKTKKYPGLPGYIPPKAPPTAKLAPFIITTSAIPKPVILPKIINKVIETNKTLPTAAHRVSEEEIKFITEKVPTLMKLDESTVPSQIDAINRILSIENGSAKTIRKYNVQRAIEILKTSPNDTGNPAIQVAAYTDRIKALRQHLVIHKRDNYVKAILQKWESKQLKMLRYLRRTNLESFVNTCKWVGVDPEGIKG